MSPLEALGEVPPFAGSESRRRSSRNAVAAIDGLDPEDLEGVARAAPLRFTLSDREPTFYNQDVIDDRA